MVVEGSILSRFVEILADSPSPEALLEVRATREEEERLGYLQSRLQEGTLDEELHRELQSFLIAEQMMGLAKAKAYSALNKQDY
jgi:hypothetical protein